MNPLTNAFIEDILDEMELERLEEDNLEEFRYKEKHPFYTDEELE